MANSGPKSECEALMSAAIPFAEEMLLKHGEFYPFGVAMISSREIVSVGVSKESEHLQSNDLIRQLKQVFLDRAKAEEFDATALVYDTLVKTTTSAAKMDAIAVSLNHRDNYSVIVFFPYHIENEQVVFGEVFAQDGESDIFN